MKLPDYKDAPSAGTFNVFTVLCVVIGYGSELGAITKPETLTIEQSLEL